jgi:hypothetical protein
MDRNWKWRDKFLKSSWHVLELARKVGDKVETGAKSGGALIYDLDVKVRCASFQTWQAKKKGVIWLQSIPMYL